MTSLPPVLLSLWNDLQDVRVLWQFLVIALALGAAAWIANTAWLRLLGGKHGDPPAGGTLSGVGFPLITLLLVLIGRWILAAFQTVHLLNLAVPLLVALTILRAAYQMSRHVFAGSATHALVVRSMSWLIWIGFGLYVSGLAPELLNYLDDKGLQLGARRISILLVLQSVATVALALLLSLWLGHVIEGKVMAAEVNINLRVMLAKVIRPLLVVIAVLVALPMVGVDLTALSVFGGALGVGLGFGLQKIASNYVSGFIILLDRSVTIGDFLTIEKHTGQLTKMTARYVVMRNGDGSEVIIPNETVITSTVVNHSYSDKSSRLPITVQISYSSDVDLASRLLGEAALAQPRVLRDPEPKVLITGFADSGINLELGVWVEDPEQGKASLRSDIYHEVLRQFRLNGIEIPFPQREVRVLAATRGAASPWLKTDAQNA